MYLNFLNVRIVSSIVDGRHSMHEMVHGIVKSYKKSILYLYDWMLQPKGFGSVISASKWGGRGRMHDELISPSGRPVECFRELHGKYTYFNDKSDMREITQASYLLTSCKHIFLNGP